MVKKKGLITKDEELGDVKAIVMDKSEKMDEPHFAI
jgi:hypothetical protein